MIDHSEKIMSMDQKDTNRIKEVADKLSRIEECDEEFTENDNDTEEKDESCDDNVMLQFDEDGNFIS